MGRHFLVNGLLTAGRQEARDRVRLGACGPPARPTVWSTELRSDFPHWPGGESWARRRLSASPQGRPGEQPRTRVCHTHSGPGQMSHSPLSHGYEVLACIWPMPNPGKHPLPMPVTPYWLRTCGQIHATPGLHQQRKKKKKKRAGCWLSQNPWKTCLAPENLEVGMCARWACTPMWTVSFVPAPPMLMLRQKQ